MQAAHHGRGLYNLRTLDTAAEVLDHSVSAPELEIPDVLVAARGSFLIGRLERFLSCGESLAKRT